MSPLKTLKYSPTVLLNVSVPTAGAVVVILLQTGKFPVVPQVTTYDAPEDAALKITSSAAVGADAPPAPPEVADQFVVIPVFQVPLPPTQYLVAI